MATKMYDTVELELQDGQLVEIKPLPIKRLRRFMKAIQGLDESQVPEGEDAPERDQLDIFLDCAAIVLEKKYPQVAHDREALEDLLDVPTMIKILEVAGSIDLSGDAGPNQGSPLGTI
jgi:hypothetical protein